MKTQNFGAAATKLYSVDDTSDEPYFYFILYGQSHVALKNYRENRENGTNQDNPKHPFPSAGYDTLDVKDSHWKSYNDWPDKQGRYWLKLTLNDGSVVENFYWIKDEVRGFPDKNEESRYWFIVHHGPSGTKIEGFSLEPDYQTGFPDKDRKYWRYIQYTDTQSPLILEWMKEKDRHYLIRTIGDLLKILDKAPLFKALPDELQLIIFEFVVGGKVSLEIFSNAKTDAKRDKIQFVSKDVKEEIETESSRLVNKASTSIIETKGCVITQHCDSVLSSNSDGFSKNTSALQPHPTRYGFKRKRESFLKEEAPQEISTAAEADTTYDEAKCSSTYTF